MRKNRGTLDPGEWNRLVSELQDLRDAGYRGEIALTELRERFQRFMSESSFQCSLLLSSLYSSMQMHSSKLCLSS